MTSIDFRGAEVVVTGGTGALGTAVVARRLDAGAICHIPNFDPEELAGFVHRADAGVRWRPAVDLADEAAVVDFYAGLPELWASIHLAGGFAMTALAETTLADIDHMIAINLISCHLCCREAAKTMRARPSALAQGHGGRIVNVAARPALEPRTGAGMAAYTAAKAAVAALTEALAEELASEAIWVNAVAPSIIDTSTNRAAMPKAAHAQWPKPMAIAETIAFLAAPANLTTRGAIVPVYGQI